MGQVRYMQPLITVKGIKESSGVTAGNVVQPVPGWLDVQNVKDALFHVQILAQDGMPVAESPGRYPKLAIETAASAAGPWATIAYWERDDTDSTTLPPLNIVVGASTRAPAFASTYTNYLERFVRWRIDATALDQNDDEWAMCFGIWVTLT
jgi:hypothetical protein